MSRSKRFRGFVLSLLVLLLCFAPQASAVETWYIPTPSDGMDTWFGSVYNKGGMPTDYRLRVGGSNDEYRGLLRFNLSGLPQVATKAEVRVYAFPDSGTPVDIIWSRVTSTWQEDTATWSNQPTSTSFGVTKAPALNWSGWIKLDITEAYNSWRCGNASSLNFGLGLTPRATNNAFTQFHSSDYMSDPALRPTLYLRVGNVAGVFSNYLTMVVVR